MLFLLIGATALFILGCVRDSASMLGLAIGMAFSAGLFYAVP